ncbi:MAG: hypothetical protein HDT18_02760 [Oscillibacter sp.]|nr:hypothetical protein [Oscillibacter sp.]
MKQCTQCSTMNPDSAKFCQGCGLTLEGVESSGTDFPSTAGSLSTKAGSVLSGNAKRANDAAAEAGKTSGAAAAQEEEIRHTVPAGGWDRPAPSSGNGHPNSGWDNMIDPNEASSVTVKKYSFFQSEEEETLAVIGERAAVSDLEGTYRGPYAVLTKERLYCKNEEGNFIIPASEVLSAKETSTKKFEWAFWATVVVVMFLGVSFLPGFFSGDPLMQIPGYGYGLMIAVIVTGIAIYFHHRNDLKKTSIALAFTIFSPGLHIIFGAIYLYQAWKNRSVPRIFSVHCVGRTFSFAMENYPVQELQDFQNQVAFLTGVSVAANMKISPRNVTSKVRGNSYQAYQPPRQSIERKGSPIVPLAATVVILVVVIFAGMTIYNALTTCKVDGCGNEVYKDGYCTRHYAGNRANQAAGDLFDSLFG